MLPRLRRYFARRRLRKVAAALPAVLRKKYGSQEVYTAGQVKRAAGDLKLDAQQLPTAFAIATTAGEFLKGQPERAEDDYARLRTEFAQLFGIDQRDFTLKHVRALRNVPNSRGDNGAHEDGYGKYTGGGDTGGGHNS